jgi:hypothetical protein
MGQYEWWRTQFPPLLRLLDKDFSGLVYDEVHELVETLDCIYQSLNL